MSGRRVAAVGLALLAVELVAVAIYFCFARPVGFEDFTVEDVGGRQRVPELLVETADGKTSTLSQLAAGRPMLLHFWASWCPPCRAELPTLLGRSFDAAGPMAIALAVDDTWPAMRKVAGVPRSVVLVRALDTEPMRRHGVTTLPETWLVSADGKLLVRTRGPRDWSRPEVERDLALALGGRDPQERVPVTGRRSTTSP